MSYLAGTLRTEKGKHRLHDRMNAILVATASITIASTYIIDGKVKLTPGAHVGAACKMFDLDLHLPVCGPVEVALAGKQPDEILFELLPRPETLPAELPKKFSVHTFGFDAVVSY